MDKLLQQIRVILLNFKVQGIKSRLDRIAKKLNPSGKRVSKDASIMSLNAESQKKIEEIRENILAIVKSCEYSAEKLLEYIQAAKTPVYRVRGALSLLSKIGEEMGFISEKRGLTALYISLMTFLTIFKSKFFLTR